RTGRSCETPACVRKTYHPLGSLTLSLPRSGPTFPGGVRMGDSYTRERKAFPGALRSFLRPGGSAELHYPVDKFIQAVAPDGIVSEDTGPDPQLWFPLVWTETVSTFLVMYLLPKATSDELQGLATTLVLSGDA